MGDFRSALCSATERLGGDTTLVDTFTTEQYADVVNDAISFIARIDFNVVQDTTLVPPIYVEVLSHWLAAGAVEGSGKLLRVLHRAGRLKAPDTGMLVQAGVSAEYLAGCFEQGIFEVPRIRLGWESRIPFEYLAAL